MEILRVENLCKVYGKGMAKVVAIDNISFQVEKGENVEENITLPLKLDNREVDEKKLNELIRTFRIGK